MEAKCEKCGADARAGELICEFCGGAIRAEALRNAEVCPECKHPNVQGTTNCTRCHHVTQCLFCQSVSPLAAAACTRCNEAFAGMSARKKARDDEAERQRLIAIGATVVGAAAPLLGTLVSELGGASPGPGVSGGGQQGGFAIPGFDGGGMSRGGGGSSDDK